jgi:hypothetical protein
MHPINQHVFLILLFPLILLLGCSENKNPVSPTPDSNILLNSSFEKNGNPATDDWEISARPYGEITNDAPIGGGNYCLKLEASNPGGMATRQFPAVSNRQIYKLSFWAKTNQPSSKAFFELIRNGLVENQTELSVIDTTWTEYSVTDTFQVMNGDSLRITFQERITQLQMFESYFDLVKVETVD